MIHRNSCDLSEKALGNAPLYDDLMALLTMQVSDRRQQGSFVCLPCIFCVITPENVIPAPNLLFCVRVIKPSTKHPLGAVPKRPRAVIQALVFMQTSLANEQNTFWRVYAVAVLFSRAIIPVVMVGSWFLSWEWRGLEYVCAIHYGTLKQYRLSRHAGATFNLS